jgi:hypothetical protein
MKEYFSKLRRAACKLRTRAIFKAAIAAHCESYVYQAKNQAQQTKNNRLLM